MTATDTAPTYDPVLIGPTWKRGADGKFILPAHTLGWTVLGWTAQWLRHDDGTPWRYTPEQARFVLWWYAVDDTGRFVFRDGVLQRLKGWGKRSHRSQSRRGGNGRAVPVRRVRRRRGTARH
jgi:hypothetical protein